MRFESVQFSSVQSLDRFGRRENMRDDCTEILFQSFLQKAFVNSSGTGRDVHSLMLSIQHFLCRPRRHSSSKVPLRMVLEMMSWRVIRITETFKDFYSHLIVLTQISIFDSRLLHERVIVIV